jgi:hypothetical protein
MMSLRIAHDLTALDELERREARLGAHDEGPALLDLLEQIGPGGRAHSGGQSDRKDGSQRKAHIAPASSGSNIMHVRPP